MMLWSPDGTTQVLGSHSYEAVGDSIVEDEVPQLIRLEPGGRRMALYEPAQSRLTIRSVLAVDKGRAPLVFRLGSLQGEFVKYRWLNDRQTLVFLTTRRAYTVRVPDQSTRRQVHARPLPMKANKEGQTWVDVRALGRGFVLQREEHSIEHLQYVSTVFYGHPLKRGYRLEPVKPDKGIVSHMSVRSGSRVVLQVRASGKKPRLFSYVLHKDGVLSHTQTLECVMPEQNAHWPASSQCRILSWSPYAEGVAYARSDGSAVVHTEDGHSVHKLKNAHQISSLWLNKTEDLLFASSASTMALWPLNGDKPFQWTSPNPSSTRIYTAHIAPDDRSVLVGVQQKLYRVTPSKMVELHAAKMPMSSANPVASGKPGHDVLDSGSTLFVDNLVPLADGRIAFVLVQMKWTEKER